MLDLHYDTLLSDGISGWAVAQGKRGKRLCSPCPLVPQRVSESGREEAGRSPCAGRCSVAGLWKTTTEAEMVEEHGFKCLTHIVSMYACCCAKTTAFGLAHLHMLTYIIFYVISFSFCLLHIPSFKLFLLLLQTLCMFTERKEFAWYNFR